jgi:hypothetical protein
MWPLNEYLFLMSSRSTGAEIDILSANSEQAGRDGLFPTESFHPMEQLPARGIRVFIVENVNNTP